MKIAYFLVSLAALGCAQSESVPAGGGAGGADSGLDASGGVGGVAESGFGGGGTGGSGGTGGGDAALGGGGGGGPCTPPVTGTCDTIPQCGCGPGEGCDVVNTTGETKCVPEGTVDPFRACSDSKTCKAGAGCVGKVCKPYCESKANCGAGKCIQVLSDPGGQGTPIPGFKVCTAACSLVDPVAICGTQAGCYPDAETPTGTDCAEAGTATGAGACTDPGPAGGAKPTLCAPAFGCVAGATPNTWDCRKWCRVGFSSDCPSAGACIGFTPPNTLFVDGFEHGVCP